MAEYLAPGVYVEEMPSGSRSVGGVATSTAAFVGFTRRGPTRPRLVTSLSGFLRLFGDASDSAAYMAHAVRGFFGNGGRRCYIARIAGDGAATAETAFGGFTIRALGSGAAGTGSGRVSARGPPRTPTVARPASASPSIAGTRRTPMFRSIRRTRRTPDAIRPRRCRPAALATASYSGALQGGDDGAAPGLADYLGDVPRPDRRTGLAAPALDAYDEVAIVNAPAAADEVASAVVAHCEENRLRFAVIDCPPDREDAAAHDPQAVYGSGYAAYYCPWIFVADPGGGSPVKVPPGGHVCGIYARTDAARGVFKSPANEIVAGALALEVEFDRAAREVLNARGVSVIRPMPGGSIRVWGGRTLATDAEWRYVSVRRLFIFIEHSIHRLMRWVVFEPNGPPLRSQVERAIRRFLTALWQDGALLGETPEAAFHVAVRPETLTEDDLESGRLVVEIGIAPARPAEFVILRFDAYADG